MSGHCDNCGSRKSSGYSTNCHEEAYIAFEQAPVIHFRKDFMAKAWEQERKRKPLATLECVEVMRYKQ